ncbi:hypothetical protein HZI73_17525 [Vallitalea pronyensis]|uniref:GGDEF domain-containing protein n=1 Tax=Vallitalea pronyensis TaxID=1348613 RepID=A0A8J8MLP5_9FIRM|nr:type III-B CRISPR-associated protein Cas10/Cmr2 [Vallitalea pronyensis]QUI23985.1 hypothetical protein HZI73_17525 [Vallitalea pronyensis]
MEDNKYIHVIKLGSVQPFITQSKKLKELKIRSQFITYLMDIIVAIVKQSGAELIVPSIKGDDVQYQSLPNQIIYMTKNYHELDIREEMIRQMQPDKFMMQYIQNELDVCVASMPIESYTQKSYHDLMNRLHGIRQRRAFHYIAERPDEDKDKIIKCKRCNSRFIAKSDDNLVDEDYLCLICNHHYLKKMMRKKQHINMESTIQIASSHWCDEDREAKIIQFYNNHVKDEHESLLYKQNITEHGIYVKDTMMSLIANEHDKANLEELHLYPNTVSRHYAVVKADIDNLGKWMSGHYLEKGPSNYKEYQEELSSKISAFAKQIQDDLAKRNQNQREILPIYIGGDDILIFCNICQLNYVLQTIRTNVERLNDNFSFVKNQDFSFYKNELTVSTSIVIAHYKIPLSNVLKLASTQLDMVKKRYTSRKAMKDGLVFTYITASRTETTCYCKGQEEQEELFDLISLFENGQLSKRFVYLVSEQLKKYEQVSSNLIDDTFILGKMAIRRILHHRFDIEESDLKNMEDKLLALYERQYAYIRSQASLDTTNFLHTLACCRLMGEERKKAEEAIAYVRQHQA